MNTAEIMQIALNLGGFADIPTDSGVWVEGDDIKRVLVGIDVGPAELLLARQLGYDCVVAHHPIQRAGFSRVFLRHRALMREAGVPDGAIRDAIDERARGIELGEGNANDDHIVSVARLLAMPFLNAHLPLDEYTRRTLMRTIEECQRTVPNATVGQVAEAIGRLPSFARSTVKPRVVLGSPDAPAGKVTVSIAAGTNGGHAVASAYFAHGIDTVVYMHIAPEDLARLEHDRGKGALIVTGHVPGDNVGIDAFVTELRRRGLEVDTFSGVDTPLAAWTEPASREW